MNITKRAIQIKHLYVRGGYVLLSRSLEYERNDARETAIRGVSLSLSLINETTER